MAHAFADFAAATAVAGKLRGAARNAPLVIQSTETSGSRDVVRVVRSRLRVARMQAAERRAARLRSRFERFDGMHRR